MKLSSISVGIKVKIIDKDDYFVEENGRVVEIGHDDLISVEFKDGVLGLYTSEDLRSVK